MLHWFGKREVFSTFNLRELAEVKPILDKNKIDYDVKVLDGKKRSTDSPQDDTRAKTGVFKEKEELVYVYVIRVNKEDLERARELLRQAGK